MSKPQMAYIWQISLMPLKFIVKTGLSRSCPVRLITNSLDEAIIKAKVLSDKYIVLDYLGNEIERGSKQ